MSQHEYRDGWVYDVTESNLFPALSAYYLLSSLDQKIREQLDFYASKANLIDSDEISKQVNALRQWLDTEGQAIEREISGKMVAASNETRDRMRKSIDAALKRLELVKDRDVGNTDNLEMIWEWAKEVLPSLRRAFRPFPNFPLEQMEQVETSILVQVSQSIQSAEIYSGEALRDDSFRRISMAAA